MLKFIACVAVALSLFGQAVLLGGLVAKNALADLPLIWLFLHATSSVVSAMAINALISDLVPSENKSFHYYCFFICFSMPFVGTVGCLGAMLYGIYCSSNQHKENVYWQFTNNAELPFTAPLERKISKLDSRGFVEQLKFSNQTSTLYKKVLASDNIQNSLSVGALKEGVKHSNEQIRLTAYQILDKKVTNLNRQIQQLERQAQSQGDEDKSNTWLQIASNYWELLTLEKDEPIARQQLLGKALNAAMNSVKILPTNRNAHFTLGRVALLQGNERMAAAAFERAMALGIPIEKAMPYRAEAAFLARDFKKVVESINRVDASYKVYPPLSHLSDYWS